MVLWPRKFGISHSFQSWKQEPLLEAGFQFCPKNVLEISRPNAFPNWIVSNFCYFVPLFRAQLSFCFWAISGFCRQDDPELAKSCWYLATVLPPVPNYVHPNVEVVVFPNGQRGVQVTAPRWCAWCAWCCCEGWWRVVCYWKQWTDRYDWWLMIFWRSNRIIPSFDGTLAISLLLGCNRSAYTGLILWMREVFPSRFLGCMGFTVFLSTCSFLWSTDRNEHPWCWESPLGHLFPTWTSGPRIAAFDGFVMVPASCFHGGTHGYWRFLSDSNIWHQSPILSFSPNWNHDFKNHGSW